MPTDRIHLYCVDGSNLARGAGSAAPEWHDEDEEARYLVEILSRLCERIGPRLEVQLYFDGPQRDWRGEAANLRVRATHEESADDMILDQVRAKKFAGGVRVTIVTGDTALGEAAVSEGAQWLKVRPENGCERVGRLIEARFLR